MESGSHCPSTHKDRTYERAAMSTTTTGVRRLALTISIITTAAIALTSCAGSSYGTDAFPKTSAFVFERFNGGQFLDTFTWDKPEAGITLEAMAQLSAVGFDKAKQARAISFANAHTDLFDSIGLKANYIFAAHALGFADEPSVRSAAKDLVAGIGDSGSLGESNNFVYSWVVFALLAEDEKVLANQVALKLSELAEADGGYKYVQDDQQSANAADVTAFAVLALQASSGTGDSAAEASKASALSKALSWLVASEIDGDHWNSFGDVDVSGTAYATMALHSQEVDIKDELAWFKSRISSVDNGIYAPWTEPNGDVFSTAQSLLALNELSFIDVLQHIAN